MVRTLGAQEGSEGIKAKEKFGSQNFTAGEDIVLKGDKQILSYKAVRTFSGANLLISSPSFKKDGSYTFGSSTISCASDKWVNGSTAGGPGKPW